MPISYMRKVTSERKQSIYGLIRAHRIFMHYCINTFLILDCFSLYTNENNINISDRAFPVAAARTWNSLPQHVTSTLSVSVF